MVNLTIAGIAIGSWASRGSRHSPALPVYLRADIRNVRGCRVAGRGTSLAVISSDFQATNGHGLAGCLGSSSGWSNAAMGLPREVINECRSCGAIVLAQSLPQGTQVKDNA